MKEWYVDDTEQILCPVCVNHILSRWIINSETAVGQRVFPVEISAGVRRVDCLKNFYNGDYLVPTMLVFESEVFMNRRTFTTKYISLGAFDDYATHIFKKTLLNVLEL